MQTGSLKPLSSLRILVTRPAERAHALSQRLRALGATTVEFPTIEIMPASDVNPLDRAIETLADYDWVVFTSVPGVEFFLKRMAVLRVTPGAMRKVAAIGPATAAVLAARGKIPDYLPTQYLSERIIDGLGDVRGKRILLPRADIASKKLPALLLERGALVDDIAAYLTSIPRGLTGERLKEIFNQGVDVVTFTSPSTVRNLAQVVGKDALAGLLRGVKVACIGPVTSDAAKELGFDVDIVAKTHTIDALVEAIVDEIRTL